jgi:hypothetical protein
MLIGYMRVLSESDRQITEVSKAAGKRSPNVPSTAGTLPSIQQCMTFARKGHAEIRRCLVEKRCRPHLESNSQFPTTMHSVTPMEPDSAQSHIGW